MQDLAHIHLYNDDRFGIRAFFFDNISRKRPEGLQFQQAEFLAPLAPVFHNVQRAAGRRAVADQDPFRVIQVKLLVAGQFGRPVLKFVHQVPDQAMDNPGIRRGKPPHIMVKAGDIKAVYAAEIRHRQTTVFTG